MSGYNASRRGSWQPPTASGRSWQPPASSQGGVNWGAPAGPPAGSHWRGGSTRRLSGGHDGGDGGHRGGAGGYGYRYGGYGGGGERDNARGPRSSTLGPQHSESRSANTQLRSSGSRGRDKSGQGHRGRGSGHAAADEDELSSESNDYEDDDSSEANSDKEGAPRRATASAESAAAGSGRGRQGGNAAAAHRSEAGPATAAPWRSAGATASGGFKSLPAHAALLRLHEEVLDFAAFITPTPAEAEIADHALAAVTDVILRKFPGATVQVFGSRASGLVLPTSDWDLVVFGVQPTRPNMHGLGAALERAGAASQVEVIASARVPIVKVKERLSGITVDVSFDTAAASGLVTRALIADFLRRYPPVRPLVLVLKYFLMQRSLQETFKGGVGSFCLVLMVVHAVQRALAQLELPAPAAGADAAAAPADAGQKRPRSTTAAALAVPAAANAAAAASALNLGALLVSFLELFGMNLNYYTTGISVRGRYGGYFSKARRGWADASRPHLLSVENPVDGAHDVGRNSYAIVNVRRAFGFAHTEAARCIRAWGDHSQAAPGRRGSGGPPTSLLSAIIYADPLLRLRAQEIISSSQMAPTVAAEGDNGGGSAAASTGAAGLGTTAVGAKYATAALDAMPAAASAAEPSAQPAARVRDGSTGPSLRFHEGRLDLSDEGEGEGEESGAVASGGSIVAVPPAAAAPLVPSSKRRRLHAPDPAAAVDGGAGSAADGDLDFFAAFSAAAAASGVGAAAAVPAAAVGGRLSIGGSDVGGGGTGPGDAAAPPLAHALAHASANAVGADVVAASSAAMSRLAASGVQLRNPQRLADLFTRKERKVQELADQVERWY